MQIKPIGIDLGKTACDVVAVGGRGKALARRRLSRAELGAWLANLPPCPERRGLLIVVVA